MMKILALCAFAAFLVSSAFAKPGSLEQEDVTTTEVTKAAEFAIQQINSQSNSHFAMILSSVLEASSQVVSGIKYMLVVEALPSTECRNDGKLHTLCSCSVDTSKPVGFQVEVLVQSWMTPSMQLLSFMRVTLAIKSSVKGFSRAKTLSIESAINTSSAGFQQFLKSYTPSYCNNAVELSKRSDIFQDNMERIKKVQETERGSAKYGVTQFADLTESEFRTQYTMPVGDLKPDPNMKQAPLMDADAAPTSFDWRDHGAVTNVKFMGWFCASSWAFSVTGNIEGQWAIKKGQLLSLSEQQLVDCDEFSNGCHNGSISGAYIQALGGLATETSYPYTAKKGKCHFKPSQAIVYINNVMMLSTDEAQMAAWLAANGPIAIMINSFATQFYIGGISRPLKRFCNPEYLDLAVLIVGYGVKGSEPYWIIKFSFGKWWGEKGYYRVYRGDGVCGLNKQPSSSIVK